MSKPPRIDEIPGTYVFDKKYARRGYNLNMFCMSLNDEANRNDFRNDEAAYLGKFSITAAQRTAVLNRDWLALLQLGGNVYYTFKLAIFDRITMQAMSGAMCEMTEEEFKRVMMTGGKDQNGVPRGKRNASEKDSG